MHSNASGVDPVAVGSLLLSFTVAVCLGVVFLFKTFKTKDDPEPAPSPTPVPGGDSALVDQLRSEMRKQDKRIENLEGDLDREREGRAEDNRDSQRRFQSLSEDYSRLRAELARLREELAVTRAQKGIT